MFDLLAAELTEEEARSLVFVFLASTLGAVLSPLAPAPRAADGRRRDRARDPHRPGGPRARRGRLVHRVPLGLRPRAAVLLRRARGDRAPRPARRAAPRDDRLGHVARDRAGVRRGCSTSWGWTRPGGCWRSRSRRRRSARSSRSSRTRSCFRPSSARAVLGTGVAGEFWPIIFISVFLTSVYGAVTEIVLLIGFAVRRRRRGRSRASCATAAAPPDRAGHAAHDRTGRRSRVGLPPRAARLPRGRRGLRVRPRRIRGGRRSSGWCSTRRTGRSCACVSRESGSASSSRSTSSSPA